MDMLDFDDETPTAEQKPFAPQRREAANVKKKSRPRVSAADSSSSSQSSSCSSSSGSSSSSSRSESPQQQPKTTTTTTTTTTREERAKGARRKTAKATSGKSAKNNPNSPSSSSSSSSSLDGSRRRRMRSKAATSNDEDEMSNSYHEIFDTQMPPETARESLRDDDDLNDEEHPLNKAEPFLVDESTSATTEYLTSKLVRDSLKWQRENNPSDRNPSPNANQSPIRRGKLSNPDEIVADSLDPTVIADLENSARHLATSVDNMVESLSGVLHSISALTVDTVETYRDGVCKTCDEVDANIKLMYQLMAKVEELNKSMAPAYQVSEQLKEIKKLLDMYEAVL